MLPIETNVASIAALRAFQDRIVNMTKDQLSDDDYGTLVWCLTMLIPLLYEKVKANAQQ